MENVFNVKYNTKLDRLEIPKRKGKFRVWSFVKNHKFLTIERYLRHPRKE